MFPYCLSRSRPCLPRHPTLGQGHPTLNLPELFYRDVRQLHGSGIRTPFICFLLEQPIQVNPPRHLPSRCRSGIISYKTRNFDFGFTSASLPETRRLASDCSRGKSNNEGRWFEPRGRFISYFDLSIAPYGPTRLESSDAAWQVSAKLQHARRSSPSQAADIWYRQFVS